MNVFQTPLSYALVLAALAPACMSAHAAPACEPISSIERRIVEHAEGDVAALRSFVWRTSIVYGVNMLNVRDHLDAWRAAVACRQEAAAASAAPPVADANANADEDRPAGAAAVMAQR